MSDEVRGVVFDLDRTLCTYRRPGSEVLGAAFDATDVEPCFEIEDYHAIADDYVAESDTGPENRRRCFAALAQSAGLDPDAGRRVADAYAAQRDHGNVRWVEGAERTIEALAREYPLAIVTNGAPEWQRAKLAALGIEDRFETVVYAGYETAPKPEPEPFEVALDALGVEPGRAVTVGDSVALDVAGAHAAGLRSVWLQPDGAAEPDPEPDYRIQWVTELTDPPWPTSSRRG